MSSTKILQINPKLFLSGKEGKKNTLKNREKKQKPTGYKGPSTLRKALLGKIRDFQKKEQEGGKIETQTNPTAQNLEDIKNFDSEFNKSLEFLKELSKRHNDKSKTKKANKIKNKTLKQSLNGQKPLINLDLPSDLVENKDFRETQIITHKQEMPIQIPTPVSMPMPTPTSVPMQVPIQIQMPMQLGQQTQVQIVPPPQQPQLVETYLDEPSQMTSNIEVDVSNIKQPTHEQKIDKNKLIFNPIKDAPPYSNLKGGKLPTYRQWSGHSRTQKHGKHNTHHPKSITIDERETAQGQKSEIDKRLQEIKNKYKKNHNNNNTLKQLVKVKTRTIKYNLGKKGKTVGILIKNRQTRKKIKDEHALLKQKSLADVKEYLREKNLIKAGTIAPTDVLRTLYEQSILSGDVTNKSKDVLLHNFITS